MASECWKELLGLKDSDLRDLDIIKRIAEAKTKNLNEIEIVLKNGETVKISLKSTKDEGILSSNAWCW